MRYKLPVLALTLAVMTVLLIGCGGNASPTPTTTAPAPSPTGGSGSGGSGSGGGTGGGAAIQYDVKMLPPSGADPSGAGEVTINTNGDVTLQLSGLGAQSYTINFCMFPVKSYSSPCFQIGTIDVGSSGTAQTTFHFPKSGTWAGLFDVRDATQHQLVQTWGEYNTFNGPMMQFELASTTNQAGAIASGTQSPGTGTVNAGNGTAHFTVTGGAKNTAYDATVCFQTDTSCHSMGQFTTDANGNATADLTIYTGSGGVAIFEAIPAGSVGLVSGFKVP